MSTTSLTENVRKTVFKHPQKYLVNVIFNVLNKHMYSVVEGMLYAVDEL